MDNPVRDIVIAILVALVCAWWWFITKETATRKYVVLWGVCFFSSCLANIIGNSFNIAPLIAVAILAFLGSIYFLIKAALSERKAKKKSSPD